MAASTADDAMDPEQVKKLERELEEAQETLRAIRQAGFVMTIAEYHPDIASIARNTGTPSKSCWISTSTSSSCSRQTIPALASTTFRIY